MYLPKGNKEALDMLNESVACSQMEIMPRLSDCCSVATQLNRQCDFDGDTPPKEAPLQAFYNWKHTEESASN